MSNISIVVPVYNAEALVGRCIDSILGQTYAEFELILVDDGSTDHTALICDQYVKADHRVTYLYQENAGPDMARRAGVRAAAGSFLMFADADDYIAPDLLKVLYEESKKTGADLICSPTIRFNDKGKKWRDCILPQERIDCDSMEQRFYHFFVTRYIPGSYYAKLIKKELLADYNFMDQSVIGEDVTAVLYLLLHAKSVRIIDRGDYFYYWNLESISHSGYTQRHKASLINYLKVKEEVISKHYVDQKAVIGFFAEYEMAVATAMSRNWVFEQETVDILKNDLKKYRLDICNNRYTSFYMKACMLLFMDCPSLFFLLYRIVYLLTGR